MNDKKIHDGLSDKAYANKKAYNIQYKKDSVTKLIVDLSYSTCSDIIDYLNSKENKAGYIKDLIRKDMENERSN